MSNAAMLNPETFVEGGGLIDDVDVTLTGCSFEQFDYNGKASPVPALKLEIEAADISVTQYYSMGALKDWMPSEDGNQLLSVGSATSIRMSSNGGILLKSLVDAGFPADKLGDDISVLVGLQAHMIQVPEPGRSMKKTKEQEEKEAKYGPKTILVVSAVNKLPWEKATPAGGKKTATKAKPKPKKAAPKKTAPKKEEPADDGVAEASDVEAKATEVIMEILAESGTVTKKELPAKIFKMRADDPDKNEMIKTVFNDDFLAAGPWTFDDGTLIAG